MTISVCIIHKQVNNILNYCIFILYNIWIQSRLYAVKQTQTHLPSPNLLYVPHCCYPFFHVQEFTGARPNYYKKMPIRSKRQKARANRKTWTSKPLHSSTTCTIVTRVRFRVLPSGVCHHVRQTWSSSFNGHAHKALPAMNSEQCLHSRHNTWINTQEYTTPRQSHLALPMLSFANHNLLGFFLSLPTHVVKPAENKCGGRGQGKGGQRGSKGKTHLPKPDNEVSLATYSILLMHRTWN